MSISPPPKTESFGYFDTYINKVNDTDLLTGLIAAHASTNQLIAGLNDEALNYRYAPGKWNIKEILGHIIDAERIFAYRALCFGRKDKTPLPSFDENLYADNSNANERDIASLLEEFYLVRKSTIALYNSFSNDVLDIKGRASNFEISARAIGYVILGHQQHHIGVVNERYLNAKAL